MVDSDPQPVIDNRSPRNGGSRPVPDPTELTDRAIAKAVDAVREYIDSQLSVRDERLRGIDTATKLNFESMVNSRQAIIDKVDHAEKLVNVKFDGVATQFADRDTLSKRESELNKIALDAAFSASKEAVAAALTAQKEAAGKQDESNQKAIDKSERATGETIKTNQELNKATTDALTKTLDEVKLQVSRMESTKIGATESRSGLYAAIGIIGTILGILIAASTVIAILKP